MSAQAGLKEHAVITSLKVLPQHTMSAMAGRLFGLPTPKALRKLACTTYGKITGVNFDEVKEPLESFTSLQNFFVRELKDGLRPIDAAADAVVAPCDGAWGACGTIDDDTALQLKGRPYSVRMLLQDDALAARFDGGSFATLYLSPRDYHRFHAPVEGAVATLRYIPGALWPVNRAGLSLVDGLFTKNERIIAFLQPKDRPDALVAMVAVGATMVGKIKIAFDDDVTTNVRQPTTTVRRYDPPVHLDKGQEWGRFLFGSTIVLLATPGVFDLDVQPEGTPLRLGTRIGSLGRQAGC
jgi:phosphatidylserine decarboxylase